MVLPLKTISGHINQRFYKLYCTSDVHTGCSLTVCSIYMHISLFNRNITVHYSFWFKKIWGISGAVVREAPSRLSSWVGFSLRPHREN
jgi:hypothetical protein